MPPRPAAAAAREMQRELPLKIPQLLSSQQLLHRAGSAGLEAGVTAAPAVEAAITQLQLQTRQQLHSSVLTSLTHSMTVKYKWLWLDQRLTRPCKRWRKEGEMSTVW